MDYWHAVFDLACRAWNPLKIQTLRFDTRIGKPKKREQLNLI